MESRDSFSTERSSFLTLRMTLGSFSLSSACRDVMKAQHSTFITSHPHPAPAQQRLQCKRTMSGPSSASRACADVRTSTKRRLSNIYCPCPGRAWTSWRSKGAIAIPWCDQASGVMRGCCRHHCGLMSVTGALRTCTVRSVSRPWYCFLLLEISMSFPCASFTMLCTEPSLAWSTLIRDSLSCLEYSLRAGR